MKYALGFMAWPVYKSSILKDKKKNQNWVDYPIISHF